MKVKNIIFVCWSLITVAWSTVFLMQSKSIVWSVFVVAVAITLIAFKYILSRDIVD